MLSHIWFKQILITAIQLYFQQECERFKLEE